MGSKADGVPLEYLARGYAVASINYRLSSTRSFPPDRDCKAAGALAAGARRRVSARPESFSRPGALPRGGHLAAMAWDHRRHRDVRVGATSTNPAASKPWSITSARRIFLQMDAHRLANGMIHDSVDSPESQLIGAAIQENKAQAAQANPITYVSKNAPPFLICHGDADPWCRITKASCSRPR